MTLSILGRALRDVVLPWFNKSLVQWHRIAVGISYKTIMMSVR